MKTLISRFKRLMYELDSTCWLAITLTVIVIAMFVASKWATFGNIHRIFP